MAAAQEAPGISGKDSAFYTWSFPGAPVRIHLYLDVVARLQKELAKAAPFPIRGRVEVAGLLLGRGDLRRSQVVEIRQFIPVLAECRPESTVALSEEDRRKFQEQLAAGESDSRYHVVGYYRTQGSEGLCLEEDDLALIHSHFRDPASVFLMIRPGADGAANAGFFFWDGGHLNADFTFLEFPFDSKLLTDVASQSPKRPVLVEPVQKAAVEAAPAPQVMFAPAPHARRTTAPLWIAAAVGVLIAGLAVLGYWNWQESSASAEQAATPGPAALSLHVERQGSELRVTWDRTSQFVATAKSGLLAVREGDRPQQDLYLDADQLRTGSVVYTPVAPNVQFRLEVYGADGKTLTESVLALTAPRAEPPKR
jgi:hypothetical protein